jgi:hypothetical protein
MTDKQNTAMFATLAHELRVERREVFHVVTHEAAAFRRCKFKLKGIGATPILGILCPENVLAAAGQNVRNDKADLFIG